MLGKFRHLQRLEESEALQGLLPKPSPVVVAAIVMAKPSDDQSLARWKRGSNHELPLSSTDWAALQSVLELIGCRRVLAPMLVQDSKAAQAIMSVREFLTARDANESRYPYLLQPFQPSYVNLLQSAGELDAVILSGPLELMDMMIQAALERVNRLVCARVSQAWFMNGPIHRIDWIAAIRQEGCLLVQHINSSFEEHDQACCLFAFPRRSQAAALRLVLPVPCSTLNYDVVRNRITGVG
jgi:hypothetical protein